LTAICLIRLGFLFIPWTSYGEELVITVLDVGQGDSILIQTPNKHEFLVDGGPNDAVVDQLGQVLPFWQRRIDGLLPSHPQADHINGFVDVLARYKVINYFNTPAEADISSYKSIMNTLEQENITKDYFLAGEEIKTDDNVYLSSLWPKSDTNWQDIADLNDVAEVFVLQFHYFKAIFTGDAGANVDQQIINQSPDVDMLKVGHHGSATGTDQQWLETIKPEISVISVGKDNKYGHPAVSTLRQLTSVGSQIWRTDQSGRITITVNQAGISVRSSK
jgi:beta-lactamase superfamily II metal-dependent hydrolase